MTVTAAAKDLCVRCLELMIDGTLADFERVVHPDAHNRESRAEPPACRGVGPAASHATALWLRSAFSDLSLDVHHVVAEDDLVVIDATMSGRHTGVFVVYGDNARPTQAFPPTGRKFAVAQTHWCRVAEHKLVEHWANRDDLGQAHQLGWLPPSPWYLVRMQLAVRRARRDVRNATG
jgi:predicted ester cyclase